MLHEQCLSWAKKKKKRLFYPLSPQKKCAVKVGKVVSASERFNEKKRKKKRGEKKQSEENLRRSPSERVEGSCATRGISDVWKMARRKRKYAESKPEHIEREMCWGWGKGFAESCVLWYLKKKKSNPSPVGLGLRVVKRRLAWRNKVLNSEYLDFSEEAKWQASRFSQGRFGSGGNLVNLGIVFSFLLVDCDISGVFPALTSYLWASGQSFCARSRFRLRKSRCLRSAGRALGRNVITLMRIKSRAMNWCVFLSIGLKTCGFVFCAVLKMLCFKCGKDEMVVDLVQSDVVWTTVIFITLLGWTHQAGKKKM